MERRESKFIVPIILCAIGLGLDAVALITFFALMIYHLLFG